MSQNKIYVGNLSYGVSSSDLQTFFSEFGEVVDAKLITDRETGRSKGFGFITFANDDAAEKALSTNGTEWEGRMLKVSLARAESPRGRGGSNGGRASSGYDY